MSEVTPAQLSLRGRLAAHASWANTADRTARTANGRAAARARFEQMVDPDGTLPEAERIARAQQAQQAHMLRMSLKASQARARKRPRRPKTEDLDATG